MAKNKIVDESNEDSTTKVDVKSAQVKKEKRLTERGFIAIVAKKGARHMVQGKTYWVGQDTADHLIEKGFAETK